MNKYILLTVLSLFIYANCFSKQNHFINFQPNHISSNSGERLRNAGVICTAAGIGMIAGGIVMVSVAGDTYYSYSTGSGGTHTEGSLLGGAGAVLIGLGSVTTAGGIVLWRIGHKKVIREKKRAAVTLLPNGFRFTYCF